MKSKKYLFFSIILMVCLGGITKNSTALGATLPNDIQCSDWAKEEVTQAYELGLIPESITRKNYKNNVTRREFCAIALRCYEKMVQKEVSVPNRNPFVDTDDAEVLRAYRIGITNGMSEDTFEPSRLINREQIATMLARAISATGVYVDITADIYTAPPFYDDRSISEWAWGDVAFLQMNDIMKGVEERIFSPHSNATIEQSILISIRAYEAFHK